MGNQTEKIRLNHSSWRLALADTYSRYDSSTDITSAGTIWDSTWVTLSTSSFRMPSRVLMNTSSGKQRKQQVIGQGRAVPAHVMADNTGAPAAP